MYLFLYAVGIRRLDNPKSHLNNLLNLGQLKRGASDLRLTYLPVTVETFQQATFPSDLCIEAFKNTFTFYCKPPFPTNLLPNRPTDRLTGRRALFFRAYNGIIIENPEISSDIALHFQARPPCPFSGIWSIVSFS